MKTTSLFLISFAALALASIGFAGPAVSSGPAQPDTDGAVYAPTTLQNTSGLSPGMNANNTAAASSSASTGPFNSTTSGSNSSASSGSNNSGAGGNSSNAGSGNALSGGAAVNPPGAVELKAEKVAEISQEKLATETAKNRETKIELGRKFDSSLLDDAVDNSKPQTAAKNDKEKASRADSETEKGTKTPVQSGDHHPSSTDTSSGDR